MVASVRAFTSTTSRDKIQTITSPAAHDHEERSPAGPPIKISGDRANDHATEGHDERCHGVREPMRWESRSAIATVSVSARRPPMHPLHFTFPEPLEHCVLFGRFTREQPSPETSHGPIRLKSPTTANAFPGIGADVLAVVGASFGACFNASCIWRRAVGMILPARTSFTLS